MKKSVCLILCICLVLGASAPAFALPISTNVILDNSKYENYLGGANGLWNYSESPNSNVTYPDTGTWATAMLRQLYSVFKYTYYINAQLESNSTYQTSNFGKAMYYFSTASFQNQFDSFDSYFDLISTRINTVNTNLTAYLPNIESGISSIASHAGTISSMLGFTASNTLKSNIDSIISGITSSNTNTSNIKSVLDNLYGALGYNSAGTLKTAISSIITNTSPISNIKSNTDYIDDIAADTSSLPTIENNTSAIKINSDYLPSINTYASNLPGIKAGTDYLDDIYNSVSNISSNYLSTISWNQTGVFTGLKTSESGSYINSNTNSSLFYAIGVLGDYNIFKFSVPVAYSGTNFSNYDIQFGWYINNSFKPIDTAILALASGKYYTDIYIYNPNNFNNPSNWNFAIKISSVNANWTGYPSLGGYVYGLNDNSKDFYTVANYILDFDRNNKLNNIVDIVASDEYELYKSNNESQLDTVMNNFTGSGAASATSTDFNDLTSGVSSVKNGLNTGVSLSNLFGIFDNSNGYSWFSSQVLNEINTVQSSNRMRGSSTPLYDQKINEIYSYMGVNNND